MAREDYVIDRRKVVILMCVTRCLIVVSVRRLKFRGEVVMGLAIVSRNGGL